MVRVAVAVEFSGTLTDPGLMEAVGRIWGLDALETETGGKKTTVGSMVVQLVTADGRLTLMVEKPVAPLLRLRLLGEAVREKLGKTQRPWTVGTLRKRLATTNGRRPSTHLCFKLNRAFACCTAKSLSPEFIRWATTQLYFFLPRGRVS